MLMGFIVPGKAMARLLYTCRVQNSLTRNLCSNFGYWDPAQFKPKKAVILTKVATLVQQEEMFMLSMFQVSRYEFEKLRHEQLTEKQLEEELTARGSNYAAVRHHHNIHKVGRGWWVECWE